MEEWRKAIMEAIHNSSNTDSSIRSYSSSAFFTRTSTESVSDEEEQRNNASQQPPILRPPNSPSQASHTNNSSSSSNASSPTPANHSFILTQSNSNGESNPPPSPSSGHTTPLSKRLAENKQVLEEYPFLLVPLEELKWSDVPRLLEQYKRMALTTLMKENRI